MYSLKSVLSSFTSCSSFPTGPIVLFSWYMVFLIVVKVSLKIPDYRHAPAKISQQQLISIAVFIPRNFSHFFVLFTWEVTLIKNVTNSQIMNFIFIESKWRTTLQFYFILWNLIWLSHIQLYVPKQPHKFIILSLEPA